MIKRCNMFKKLSYILISIVAFIFAACNSDKIENIPTFTVTTSHFEDILEITGLVEPIEISTYSVPPQIDGEVIFLIEDDTQVKPGDTLCIIEDKNIQQNYEEQKTKLESLISELEKLKVDLAARYELLEAQVQNNEAEMKLKSMDSLHLQFLTPNQQRIKKLELEQSEIVKNQLQKRLKSLAIINQSEIRGLELQIEQIKRRVESTEQELKSLIILSNESGIASRAMRGSWRKVRVGDNVWQGLPVVLVPKTEKMKVKIQAAESDYKLINIGDSVTYTFDAMPRNKGYGKVLMKAPVGQPIKEGSKVKIFELETSIEQVDEIPKPEYSARCCIYLKTIPDTLVIPQVAIFEEDSIRVVYVKKGKVFEKREIKTGTSSLKSAIVSEGLKEKEIISLSKPASELIRGEKRLVGSE